MTPVWMRWLVAATIPLIVSGCNKELDPIPDPSAGAPSAASANKPLDRLAPGELQPGTAEIYGLVLPRGMKVTRKFKKAGYGAGRLPPEEVANYVRERVHVERVELGTARTIFPVAMVKLGDPTKRLRIEIVAVQRNYTELEVHDITNPPTVEGLSESERWRRAGFNEDGTPLNPMQLE